MSFYVSEAPKIIEKVLCYLVTEDIILTKPTWI